MDELMDFFDLTKDFPRVALPRGCISGNPNVLALESQDSLPKKREYRETKYNAELLCKEKRNLDMFAVPVKQEQIPRMEQCENPFIDEEENLNYRQPDVHLDEDLYSRYNFDLQRDESLPIYGLKDQILAAIESNPVVILVGNTGCGKTTQVPQYILDAYYMRREYCKIVCTQPRRIAAVSISKRVSAERSWPDGTVCSYQIGLYSNLHQDTRILYCTTGVLLQRLIKEKTLAGFTHIILDEVHERDQEMDFLLIVIRRLLAMNSQTVKIILMSATINTEEFSEYFTIRHKPAPIVSVDSRPVYGTKIYYLNDLERIQANKIEINLGSPGISDEMYNAALKLLLVFENIEKYEREKCQAQEMARIDGSILVFLPGIHEIETFAKRMDAITNKEIENIKLYVIRLHSLVSTEEQEMVFMQAPSGFRKVILATNIAESSITVPDVKFVIDFCLTKVLINNSFSNFSSLQLQWASRANCRQRAGRAGRVVFGRVYRMVQREFYENFLDEYGIPEMVRCPLETVVLKSKMLDMGSPPEILSLAMTPPNLVNVRNTILQLKEISALYQTVDGIYTEDDGDISYIGRIMDALPLDVRLSRLIILGYTFGVLRECIVIAAGLSVRSIFYHLERKTKDLKITNPHDSFLQKLIWADGSGSDLIAIWRTYNVYLMMCHHHHVTETQLQWSKRYNINLRSMREMHIMVNEFTKRLERMNIRESNSSDRVVWSEREKTIIMKIVFAGAFYPNYFIRNNQKTYDREHSISHSLSGRDPCNTVYFTNFQTRSMGELYINQIKELFKAVHIPEDMIEVTFQPGSEKVFVTFKNNSGDEDDEFDSITNNNIDENFLNIHVPGRVHPAVIKAVRMRIERACTTIRILDPRVATRYVQTEKIGYFKEGVWHPNETTENFELMVLPSVHTEYLTGCITHIDSCSKFYFQPISEKQTLSQIKDVLNDPNAIANNCLGQASDVSKGMLLAVPLKGIYQRARVIKVLTSGRRAPTFRVRFVDFGNCETFELHELRYIAARNRIYAEMPPRLLQCRLAMVQPSVVKSINNLWPSDANKMLDDIAQKGTIDIEIYSLVDNVANVTIPLGNVGGDFGHLHEILIAQNLARPTDEDYMSKCDHDNRLRQQALKKHFSATNAKNYTEEYLRSTRTPRECRLVKPPNPNDCTKSITLRGPYSPLETSLHSLMRIGTWKSATIERDSVNSVQLDGDPQDFYDRLLVAASVTEGTNGDQIVARSTTQMPNIHGFAAFMIMLFSPTIQLKCNVNQTKFVSILAGLGYDKRTFCSLFEEHDLVLNLDVDILKDDIEIINKMRYLMDAMFYTANADEQPSCGYQSHDVIRGNLKLCILRLLSKNRHYVETHSSSSDYKWEHQDDLEGVPNVFDTRTLFPSIQAQKLYGEHGHLQHVLRENCTKLHKMRQYDNFAERTKCKLCNIDLENISQLRIHLLSQLHRDRECQIQFKLNP